MFTIKRYLADHYTLKSKTPRSFIVVKVMSFAALGSILGYLHGYNNSTKHDQRAFTVEFQGQEEQFFQLLDTTSKPIIKMYYSSGLPYSFALRPQFLKAAEEFHEDLHFMLINCSNHYQHCRNLNFERLPLVQVMLPEKFDIQMINQKHQMDGVYPTFDSSFDYSVEGIKGFLEKLTILKPKDYTYNASQHFIQIMQEHKIVKNKQKV